MERGKGLFIFLFIFTLLSRFSCLLSFPANHKKKTKNKKTKFPHNGVRSWLAYRESLHFQVFSLFLICCDRTRYTAKSIHSREDKKKNFPFLFLIRRDRIRCTKKSKHSQERQQSETKTIKI